MQCKYAIYQWFRLSKPMARLLLLAQGGKSRHGATHPGVWNLRMSRELFVAYFRTGKARQGRAKVGLEAQHGAVAEYLDGCGGELVGEFTEVENGQRCDRPALARALEVCRRQKATLIIARLDRLARDASVLFALFDAAADCAVVFCDPPQVAPARPGRFLITQMADAAEPEPGRGSRWERGAWASTPDRRPDWGEPAPQEREPADRRTDSVARRLADERAANTLPIVRALQASGIGTLQGMADALNARGIPTARGARWYPTTVRNLLGRDPQGSQHVAA
jgi:DNA invertase Pin-like site-specific DNA recombinase